MRAMPNLTDKYYTPEAGCPITVLLNSNEKINAIFSKYPVTITANHTFASSLYQHTLAII
jgi:hypothetical protein